MRRTVSVLSFLLVALLVLPAVAPAAKKKNERRGGPVSAAWPTKKHAEPPANPLAQWLAKQVGPVDEPSGLKVTATTAAATAVATPKRSLALVRSFEIPDKDPDYDRLANLSWTYDNALAALAWVDLDEKQQAAQLLDQLQALQVTDGSLSIAYDVATGGGSGAPRANSLAWVGIAAVQFRDKYHTSRYDKLIGGLADYLLALRRSDGLVTGGANVEWVSTQHNILTAEFFREAGREFGGKELNDTGISGAELTKAYEAEADSIVNKLLVESDDGTYFVQGLDDARIALDVQALGSVLLELRGDKRAAAVAESMNQHLYLAPFGAESGTWSGYKPFAGSNAPAIVWSEGTIQADWAFHRLALPAKEADAAVLDIYATTNKGTTGPMGASSAFSDRAWGEFPDWPTSAAGSWLLIVSGGGNALFA